MEKEIKILKKNRKMRKVIKPAVVCDKCGSEFKSEEYDYFCDY